MIREMKYNILVFCFVVIAILPETAYGVTLGDAITVLRQLTGVYEASVDMFVCNEQIADADGDGEVNSFDDSMVMQDYASVMNSYYTDHWLEPEGDINNDGVRDWADWNQFYFQHWEEYYQYYLCYKQHTVVDFDRRFNRYWFSLLVDPRAAEYDRNYDSDGERESLAYELAETEALLFSVDSERDSLLIERDMYAAESRRAVISENEMLRERDAAVSERDSALLDRDIAVIDRDAAEMSLSVYRSSNSTELQDSIDGLASRVTSLNTENGTLTAENFSLSSSLTAANAENTTLTAENSSLSSSFATVNAENTTLTAENSSLSASLTTANAENVTLTATIVSLDAQIATAGGDLVALVAERDTLTETLSTRTGERDTALTNLATANASITTITEQYEETLYDRRLMAEVKHAGNTTDSPGAIAAISKSRIYNLWQTRSGRFIASGCGGAGFCAHETCSITFHAGTHNILPGKYAVRAYFPGGYGNPDRDISHNNMSITINGSVVWSARAAIDTAGWHDAGEYNISSITGSQGMNSAWDPCIGIIEVELIEYGEDNR